MRRSEDVEKGEQVEQLAVVLVFEPRLDGDAVVQLRRRTDGRRQRETEERGHST